jgi:hypothetical protein
MTAARRLAAILVADVVGYSRLRARTGRAGQRAAAGPAIRDDQAISSVQFLA